MTKAVPFIPGQANRIYMYTSKLLTSLKCFTGLAYVFNTWFSLALATSLPFTTFFIYWSVKHFLLEGEHPYNRPLPLQCTFFTSLVRLISNICRSLFMLCFFCFFYIFMKCITALVGRIALAVHWKCRTKTATFTTNNQEIRRKSEKTGRLHRDRYCNAKKLTLTRR